MSNEQRAEGFWWVRRETVVGVGHIADDEGPPWRVVEVFRAPDGELRVIDRWGPWSLDSFERLAAVEWGPYLGKEPTRTQALLSAVLQDVGNDPGWPDSKAPCLHRGTLGRYSDDGSQCSTCGAFVPFVKPFSDEEGKST